MKYLDDFIGMLFPNLCHLCGNNLFRHEKSLCSLCIYKLPKTNFHLHQNNPVYKIFWGRVPINAAASFLHFKKKGMVQSLIHQFKYKGKKDIGFLLGKLYGYELMQSKRFEEIDLIIPVPLHRKKLLKRGFNQSAVFASGLSNSMNIKMDANNLSRSVFSETQTKKSRLERWKNVEHVFRLKRPEELQEKKFYWWMMWSPPVQQWKPVFRHCKRQAGCR
mgnify:CR=1 FL=1